MFTGIITALGRIVQARALGEGPAHGLQLEIQAPAGYLSDVALGDSIAIQGACMTATAIDAAAGRFCVDVSAESLAHTAGLAQPGPVNLEKALRAGDRLGGHIVSGHVDGVGRVTRLEPAGESWALAVLAPPELARFLARKGSVAINGVSLTVNGVSDRADGCELGANLIPHTMHNTTLHTLAVGGPVNIEVDLIARHVERMLGCGLPAPGASA